MDFHRRKCQFLEKNYTIQKSYSKNKKSSSFHSRSKNDGIMVIFGSGAESRPGKPWGQPTKARYNPSRLRPKKTREVALERG